MNRVGQQFRTRVGARVVGLFVLSALLPLGAMGVVSMRAVYGQLDEHSRERIGQLARNAGQSVLQQALLAERGLRKTRDRVVSGGPAAVDTDALPAAVESLWIVDANGVVTPLVGAAARPRTLTGPEHERLGRDAILMRVPRAGDRTVWAALSLDPDDPSRGVLAAELHADSLWSAAETFVTLPTVVDFCLLGAGSEAVHCSSGTHGVATAVREAALGAQAGAFTVDTDDARLNVGRWSFYPARSFESDPWTVLVAESSATARAPLEGFVTTFLLTLFLALLLVILLSSVQIRQTLEPLRSLHVGTRLIESGDLSARVRVEGKDEFAELAGSFNGMAAELGSQFAQFEAMRAIADAALGGTERDEIIVRALESLPAVSGCRSAAVMLTSAASGGAAEMAWLTGPDRLAWISFDLEPADDAWLLRHPDFGRCQETWPRFAAVARRGLGKGTLFALPHVVKGSVQGATLIEMEPLGADPPHEVVRRVRQIVDQVAVALDDIRLVVELEQLGWGSLAAFSRAIDAKSEWTAGHSERVTEMALALARELGHGPQDLTVLHRGGLLHDIGKIGVPNEVLDKGGRLTPAEHRIVRRHPEIGAKILAPVQAFAPAIPIVLHHHERWDGRGYPAGLIAEEIDSLTRILTVADAFDAMASARPYRPGLPLRVVVDRIVADAGTQFDPLVVEVLLDHMASKNAALTEEVSHVVA